MTKKLLLPHWCKRIGWFVLIPATILGTILTVNGNSTNGLHTKVFALFSDRPFEQSHTLSIIDTDITYTIVGVLFIIGALLVGFSKEKQEDEFIAELRLSSLLWAVWVNYGLLLLAFLFIYGLSFLSVTVYNMFTVLIIFIVRFNYILYKNAIAIKDEK